MKKNIDDINNKKTLFENKNSFIKDLNIYKYDTNIQLKNKDITPNTNIKENKFTSNSNSKQKFICNEDSDIHCTNKIINKNIHYYKTK